MKTVTAFLKMTLIGDEQSFESAQVEIQEALVPAFIIEKHADTIHRIRVIQSCADGRRHLYSTRKRLE